MSTCATDRGPEKSLAINKNKQTLDRGTRNLSYCLKGKLEFISFCFVLNGSGWWWGGGRGNFIKKRLIPFAFGHTFRVSLGCMLVQVQYRDYVDGLFIISGCSVFAVSNNQSETLPK